MTSWTPGQNLSNDFITRTNLQDFKFWRKGGMSTNWLVRCCCYRELPAAAAAVEKLEWTAAMRLASRSHWAMQPRTRRLALTHQRLHTSTHNCSVSQQMFRRWIICTRDCNRLLKQTMSQICYNSTASSENSESMWSQYNQLLALHQANGVYKQNNHIHHALITKVLLLQCNVHSYFVYKHYWPMKRNIVWTTIS